MSFTSSLAAKILLRIKTTRDYLGINLTNIGTLTNWNIGTLIAGVSF